MKAIILAAGMGTRLSPMTLLKPKPLLEIKGKTILENMIKFLKSGGVDDITVVTGYKNELFDIYIKKNWDSKKSYIMIMQKRIAARL